MRSAVSADHRPFASSGKVGLHKMYRAVLFRQIRLRPLFVSLCGIGTDRAFLTWIKPKNSCYSGMWGNMRILLLLYFAVVTVFPAQAAEPCKTIHGRAHRYGGDGQLRIWHIGTRHEYEPDESSWQQVEKWLEAGVTDNERAKYASPVSAVYMYADFLICPIEPFRRGAVQRAKVKRAVHRHYTRNAE